MDDSGMTIGDYLAMDADSFLASTDAHTIDGFDLIGVGPAEDSDAVECWVSDGDSTFLLVLSPDTPILTK